MTWSTSITRTVAVAAVALASVAVVACDSSPRHSGRTATASGATRSARASGSPASTQSATSDPSPTETPTPAGLGHSGDCHAYFKLDQNSSLNSIIPNRWLCFDRTPTGMLSITADVHDIAQPLDYAKQVCSLVPDATVQRGIGSFLVVIMEDTQQPTGINASCNYTLRVGRLTGEVKTAIFPVPFDRVDSGCTGTPEKEPDGLSLRAFTVAGVRGTVNGPPFSAKDKGYTQTWDYRLPIRLVNGDAICQESKVELEYQPGSFGGKGGIVSPAHFNTVSQRLVADLAVALKPKAH